MPNGCGRGDTQRDTGQPMPSKRYTLFRIRYTKSCRSPWRRMYPRRVDEGCRPGRMFELTFCLTCRCRNVCVRCGAKLDAPIRQLSIFIFWKANFLSIRTHVMFPVVFLSLRLLCSSRNDDRSREFVSLCLCAAFCVARREKHTV